MDKLRRGSRTEEIEQRAAEVAERKALMDRAEHDYQRAQRLHTEQIISTAELQRFQAEYLAAKEAHQRMIAAHRMTQAGPRPEEIAQAEADLLQAQARADRVADEIRRTAALAARSPAPSRRAARRSISSSSRTSASRAAPRTCTGRSSSPAGVPLRLTEIADVAAAAGPTKVQHVDQDRSISITVNVKEQMALEAALTTVENDLIGPARLALPLGYTINVAGHARDLVEAFNALKWSYVLAQIVIYLLLASLFESWLLPFYIMFSVPLAGRAASSPSAGRTPWSRRSRWTR